MNYQEVKDKLLSKEYNISDLGTDRIKKVLGGLGNPQNKLKVIHVVGTNGKGSVSTMIASIFNEANIKVGLFNSPYITELTEYISLADGSLHNISQNDFAYYASKVFEIMDIENCKLTHFEFVTVLAVLFYYKNNCDIVVMEAGLGGKGDATNIFNDDICTVITATSFDHTGFLGNSIEEIIDNKLGIAKKAGTVISIDAAKYYDISLNDIIDQQDKIVSKSGKCIIDYCNDNNMSLIYPSSYSYHKLQDDTYAMEYEGIEYLIPSQALYQLDNASLAITASKFIASSLYIELNENSICNGLLNFKLKSRFEVLSENPLIIMDGAHNPACAKALLKTISGRYNDKKKIVITGVMADKDIEEIYYYIDQFADEYIVVDNGIPRAEKSVIFAKKLSKYGKKVTIAGTTKVAAALIKNSMDADTMVIFAGTLYMTDEFKRNVYDVMNDEVVSKEAETIIHRLTSTSFYSKSSNLPDMAKLLEKLGSPQDSLKTIHIAGTNGKGSTSKMMYEILRGNNKNVGLFTSPYIEVFNERIQFNGEVIENELLVAICELVLKMQDEEGLDLNQFGLLTCIAYIYYKLKCADYIVMETGLGGTYDPTNLTKKPEVCIITNIGLDHMAVLGNTISEIAGAKAGIIKDNVPVCCYPVEIEAYNVIETYAKNYNAPLITFDKTDVEILSDNKFIYNGCEFVNSLVGDFQCYNAVNAIIAYDLLCQNDSSLDKDPLFISNCLTKVTWPGRLEKLSDNPLVYIDGGHNEQCVTNVMEYFKKHYSDKKLIVIAGFMKDKDYNKMLNIISDASSSIHLIPVNYYRSLSYLELTNLAKDNNIINSVSENMNEAYNNALAEYDDKSVILITGSLYQISDAYNMFGRGGLRGRK